MSSAPSRTAAFTFTRAPAVDTNPAALAQRANTFASQVATMGHVTMLARREGNAMRTYLLTHATGRSSGGDPARTALALAHVVGARSDETEIPDGLAYAGFDPARPDEDEGWNTLGWLEFEDGSAMGRDPQVGVDPNEMARLLADHVTPGSWVAITARKAGKSERNKWRAWLSHRLGPALPNHHSMSPDAMVVSVYAAGPDTGTVAALLESTRAAMPGFDLASRPCYATRWGAAGGWLLSGLAMIVLAIAGPIALHHLIGTPATTPAGAGMANTAGTVGGVDYLGLSLALLRLIGFAAALPILVGLGRYAGWLPSPWKRARAAMLAADFSAPASRPWWSRARSPRKERTVRKGEMTKTIEAFDGDYPLAPDAFLVGPQVVTGLVSPHTGSAGVSSTSHRPAPTAMLDRIGPPTGLAKQGGEQRPAYLSAWDAEGGLAITGKAGSGKSALLTSVFGWVCLDRQHHKALEREGRTYERPFGYPGQDCAVVAIESKGEGVLNYKAWADYAGEKYALIDAADPTSWAIDVFDIGPHATVMARAEFAANMFRELYGSDGVGSRAFESLLALIPAAFTVKPDMAATVPGLDPNASPLYYLHVLLGGRGDETALALAGAVMSFAQFPDAADWVREVAALMAPIYGPGITPAKRRDLTESSRNKLRELMLLEHWFSAGRRKVTWRQVLEGNRVVVINTGRSASGQMIESGATEQLSSMLLYSLKRTIEEVCVGWQAQGRSVYVFSDELKLLLGAGEDNIVWLKDQGRAFGVRACFATQRLDQLPDSTRRAFRNFSTFITYTQEDLGAAREVAEAVGDGSDGDWTTAEIMALDVYTAVVRGTVGKKRQPGFVVTVPEYAADKDAYAITAGYRDQPAPFAAAASPWSER